LIHSFSVTAVVVMSHARALAELGMAEAKEMVLVADATAMTKVAAAVEVPPLGPQAARRFRHRALNKMFRV
jgi:imidazolonepropionase-like amidohydrolase